MRMTVIGLCAVLSSQALLAAARQEPTRFPQEKSTFSHLFRVPPVVAPRAPKAPDWLQIDLSRVIRQEIRPVQPRVACGIRVIEGDPNVDRKIVIPIPAEGQNAKIRVISPPPCER